MEDPFNKIFLKFCFVCQEQARPGSEHLKNYGGVVCYSCRAFWRRSHQRSKTPNFVCKSGGKCAMTVQTRRRCKKCRYDRCLRAGMVPEAVLDESQKKIRFRKLIQKKRLQSEQVRGARPAAVDSPNEEDDEEEEMEIDDPEASTSQTLETQRQEDEIGQVEAEQVEVEQVETLQAFEDEPNVLVVPNLDPEIVVESFPIVDDRCKDLPQHLKSKIDSMSRKLQMASAQTRLTASDDLMSKLNAVRNGDETVDISKQEIFHLVAKLSEEFRHFALLQR